VFGKLVITIALIHPSIWNKIHCNVLFQQLKSHYI